MATERRSLRCPLCGLDRIPAHFQRKHVIEAVVRQYSGGKNAILLERAPLTLEEALALRQSLADALRRMEEEIQQAGYPIESFLAA